MCVEFWKMVEKKELKDLLSECIVEKSTKAKLREPGIAARLKFAWRNPHRFKSDISHYYFFLEI
jgi:hypothetical protein